MCVAHARTPTARRYVSIKNAQEPYNAVGQLEVCWTPLQECDPLSDDSGGGGDLPNIESPEDLIGKPWTYRSVHERIA
jgi:hypothetical protein